MMRLHFKDFSRVHGIITEGGTAHNTITAEAKAVFNIRALEYEYMMELVDIIKDCKGGAAIATRTEVEVQQLDVGCQGYPATIREWLTMYVRTWSSSARITSSVI